MDIGRKDGGYLRQRAKVTQLKGNGGSRRPRRREGGTSRAGVLAGLAVCGGVIALAVASFGLNPVTPVFVSFGAIAGGAYLIRRTHDPILRGLAIGLVAGGIVAVLLWPLFDVNADGGRRAPPARVGERPMGPALRTGRRPGRRGA